MKRGIYRTIITTLAVALFSVLIADLTGFIQLPGEDSDGSGDYGERITYYDDGNYTYHYTEEDIRIDYENCVTYVDNLINVYLYEEISDGEKEALAAQADGVVVTDIHGNINMLQILVEESDFDRINACADILAENDAVLDAVYEVPVYIEETVADNNPWAVFGIEDDRGNESSPAGNDWWAEAIGAYTAWEFEEYFQNVCVGVVDTGLDLSHPDLSGITLLSEYPEYLTGDHGTSVASIIGAADNTIGLRGVASCASNNVSIYYTDWVGKDIQNHELAYIYELMALNGAKVINNSWGMMAPSESTYYSGGEKNETYEQYMARFCNDADASAIRCIYVMVELLMNGQDILIEQGAGNGYSNGGSGYDNSVYGWFFTGIREELFADLPDDVQACQRAVMNHILIVGAVENTLSSGNYVMSSFSNYGSTVDICAPGTDIFAAIAEGENGEYGISSGTSLAGPMAAGAAAVLWEVNPDLTAAEVRNYLLNNYETCAVNRNDSSDLYPMLNVGSAVTAEVEDMQRGSSYGYVYDKETDEPVEDATVIISAGSDSILLDTAVRIAVDETGYFYFEEGQPAGTYNLSIQADGYEDVEITYEIPEDNSTDFGYFIGTIYMERQHGSCYGYVYARDTYEPIEGATIEVTGNSFWISVTASTEDDGYFYIEEGLVSGSCILTVQAYGYTDVVMTYEITEENTTESGSFTGIIYMEEVPEITSVVEDDFSLKSKLSELADEYGVISTGTWEYGIRGTVIPADQLSGLLCADIYNYDGDGENELFVVRFSPESYSLSTDYESWTEILLTLSVYDKAESELTYTVELTDSLEVTTFGIPEGNFSTSVQLFRGEADGEVIFYLDYYWDWNDQVFDTLGFTYDGRSISTVGGVECAEHYASVLCSSMNSLSGLTSAYNMSLSRSEDGWTELYSNNFEESINEGSMDYLNSGYFSECRSVYEQALEGIGLSCSSSRTWFNDQYLVYEAQRIALWQQGRMDESYESWYSEYSVYLQNWYYDVCTCSPSQLFTQGDGGSITELCGILAPVTSEMSSYFDSSGKELTCYDYTGILDEYRE